MLFRCRDCGRTSPDIDLVLNGTCPCGSTKFHLISEDKKPLISEATEKETLRRDLHRWLDLNIDSVELKDLPNLRVTFELN